jgi:Tol biopolymer transport system component
MTAGPRSPNGRHLAYASCHELVYQGDCDVMLLDLDSTLRSVGPARRLTPERFWRIRGLSWTRDGQSIVFAGGLRSVFVQLWRAGIDGGHPPVRLEDAGPIAEAPVLAPSTGGLAFSRTADDEDLFLVAPGGEGHPIARSTTKETDAQFSPDGKRIAFCSARTGNSVEIWIADADGTATERLTRGLLRDHPAQRESKHITRRHADPVEKRKDVRRHCVDCAGHRAGRAADAGIVEQDDFSSGCERIGDRWIPVVERSHEVL